MKFEQVLSEPLTVLDVFSPDVHLIFALTSITLVIRGLFHYWEGELTFGNFTNLWRLAKQKVS